MRELARDVYEATGRLKLMPGWFFPVRTTLIRLEDGSLWVHSPIALSEELARAVDALGTITTLVAPSLVHHLFIADWKSRWPDARVIGPPGLKKKRPDLTLDATLSGDASLWPGLLQVRLEGVPAVQETVFAHLASRTLICTDLIFNLHENNVEGWLSPWMFRLVNAYGRPSQSRLVRWVTKDRARAGQSVRRMLDLPFDRLVMAHGDVIEHDGKAVLASACAWMLEGDSRVAAARTQKS